MAKSMRSKSPSPMKASVKKGGLLAKLPKMPKMQRPKMATVSMMHGLGAAMFTVLFLCDAMGMAVGPSMADMYGGSNTALVTVCLYWMATAMGACAAYELMVLPKLPASAMPKVKMAYLVGHVGWSAVSTYSAMHSSIQPLAWLLPAMFYCMTLAGLVAKA